MIVNLKKNKMIKLDAKTNSLKTFMLLCFSNLKNNAFFTELFQIKRHRFDRLLYNIFLSKKNYLLISI